MAPDICKPNGYLWKMTSGQFGSKSLEWTHWYKYMEIAEFNLRIPKDDRKDKMRILDKEGRLRTAEEYGDISLNPGSYSIGKLPYFIKISKIREVIYYAE